MDLLHQLPNSLPGPGATGFGMAPWDPPFPVHIEPYPRPDLAKLGGEAVLIEDGGWGDWIAQKRERLRDGSALLIGQGASQDTQASWVDWISHAFLQHVPNGPIDLNGAFPWLGGVRPESPSDFFQALTLSLQEDFVLMVPDDSYGLSAQVLSVCFPSGWRPAEKLGQSLLDIHAPVADNAALQRAVPAMAQAMMSKGPFVRYVWTLAGNGRLARRPNEDTLAEIHHINDLWFRSERQITIPLSGRASLFLIRVFTAPYLSVVNTPERQRRMIAAISAMSLATIAYKNISRAADLILKSVHV